MSSSDDTGGQASRAYWQSLAEWLEPGSTKQQADDTVDRREILKLLGASLGLAGVAGCAPNPTEKLVPFVDAPREMTPGIAQQYATSMELDGFATGLLVKSHDGRPTKIEGNPDHPASLGAAGPYEQASVLGLYDPHRAQASRYKSSPTSFDQVIARFASSRDDGGARLRFLLEPTGSPLIGDLIRRIVARFPTRASLSSPLVHHDQRRRRALAFRTPSSRNTISSRASTILSIDADFLSAMPFHLRMAARFRRATSHEPAFPLHEPPLRGRGESQPDRGDGRSPP